MMNKFVKNWYLIKELSKRDVINRYKGSIFGVLWAFAVPFAMFFVFAFVFGEIFHAKWPKSNFGNDMETFAINLFIGLSIFWFFSEVIMKAPVLFSSVPNYIKKVIFPLWILPIVSILSSLFNLMIYFAIIIIAIILSGGKIEINIISLVIIIAITFPFLLGVSYLLGSIGVYVKDINAIIGVLVNMLIFLSPVFYPLSNIPKNLQWIFWLNPVTAIIEETRKVLVNGLWPDWSIVIYYFIASLITFIVGYKIFNITKKGFADVL